MFGKLKKFDWVLYSLIFIFLSISIVLIYSITYVNAKNLAIDQAKYAVIGLAFMFGLSFVNYKYFKNWSPIFYFIGLAGLLIVWKLGHSQFGATRWIRLGFFDLQPSEIFKLVLITTIASFLSAKARSLNIKNLIYLFAICLIPIVIVVLQPDLGTSIVLFVILVGMLFSSGLKKVYTLSIIGIILIALPIVFLSLKDYQKQRIEIFLNPEKDPSNKGYNVAQSKITVGSGGLYGKGLGKGSQSELDFLPVAHTDFIFAGLGEVTGFVGSFILIIIYFLLFYRIASIANTAADNFGSMVAIGIGILFLFQFFINVSMNIGLAPVVGVPLPFISYGGSSLVANLMAVGILQSIYSYKDYKKY